MLNCMASAAVPTTANWCAVKSAMGVPLEFGASWVKITEKRTWLCF